MTEDSGKIERQVDRQDYFERLPEIDRKNIRAIVSTFDEVLREKERRGILKAVGGTIDKPHPRKDIDITLRLVEEEADKNIDDFPDYLEYSRARYTIFQDIIREVVSRNQNLEIEEEIEPTIDEEHDNPSILKNDGTIKIRTKAGTLIEVIRIPETAEAGETKPYVLLTEVLKAA